VIGLRQVAEASFEPKIARTSWSLRTKRAAERVVAAGDADLPFSIRTRSTSVHCTPRIARLGAQDGLGVGDDGERFRAAQ